MTKHMIPGKQYNTFLMISPKMRKFLDASHLEGIEDSLALIRHFETAGAHQRLNDFAFVVFPTARAYEGFLKLFFKELSILNESHYRSRHFRIGRSFNPDLPHNLRDEAWLYDDVVQVCGAEFAREMWQMWLDGRNHLFHYFPDDRHHLSFAQSRRLVMRFLEVMEGALDCA